MNSKLVIGLFASFFLMLFYASAQNQSDKMFIFGHSLIDHRPPKFPTPSNETTIPHWLFLLNQTAGRDFAAGGQYGFLTSHAHLPPIAQWGYDLVPGVWESDTEPFSDADITTVMITAGNFMQWQAPNLDYPTDPGVTPISATEDILDWVVAQEESIHYYIYENWPDMAEYLSGGFPPTQNEYLTYNNYTRNEFHDWWLQYQDALLASRPLVNIRMIPVGPILSKVLVDHLSNSIQPIDLYEDDAPHGRPTIYFLASLITYMGIYNEPAPLDFSVPDIIDQDVIDNYAFIVNFIWSELQQFNTPTGESRVFYSTTSTDNPDLQTIAIYPNPVRDSFYFDGKGSIQGLQIYSILGMKLKAFQHLNGPQMIDVSDLEPGFYILEVDTLIGKEAYRLIVE